MRHLLSAYGTTKTFDMGIVRKQNEHGGFALVYPHSIDADLLRMYAQGMTVMSISKKMGISYYTVRKRLIEQGANPSNSRRIKDKVGFRINGRRIDWSDDMVKKLIELYPDHTNADIAEYFGLLADHVKKKAILLRLRKDKEWLRKKRLDSIRWATYKSKKSPNRKAFQKGNTYGKPYQFKKGKVYDKAFFEKYKRGEVTFP